MEVKNLFSKFVPSEEKKEYFLALEIAPQYVWAAVWQTEEGKVKVVSSGGKEKWDGENLESLTAASDASLASALEDLPEEPNKVIFGLPETWVSGNKIVSPRRADLKALCQKLDLRPLGFVVTTEAIIQYLKILEGTLLSSILIHLGKKEILLSLVRLGKNLGTQAIGRSENLGDDVYEGIARFGKEEAPPSRILLYDTELEEERQALLAYEWEESLFLHFPKVEILEKETSIKAVAIAGGREVVESLGLKKQISAEDVGFLQGKDVMEEKEERPKKKFVLPKFKLPEIKLPKIKIKIPQIKLPKKKHFPLVMGAVAVFLFIFGGAAVGFYWYYPKAEVTVFVEAKSLEEELEVGIDPNLTIVDFAKKQIPGESVEVRVKESKERVTTGEKLVGDRAKGEVTVHNFTSGTKSFPKGTAVVGPDGKELTLDVDIMIASASSTFDEEWREVITPGKTKITVTASKIGPEYNLASESEFDIKGHSSSSYRAKNEKAFSGGTSRQVRVVSAEDQEGFLAELTAELEEKIKEELSKTAPEGKKILEEGILTSVVSRDFDQAVGAEAEKLKLKLEMKARTLAYSPEDLDNLLARAVTDSIPADFVLKKIETKTGEGKIEEEGKAVFKIHLKANLIPDIDLEELKKNLVGKYPEIGEEYLGSLTGFVKAKIIITPNLPPRLRTFPRLAKNIDIQIEIEE